jgi:hypothetical protein
LHREQIDFLNQISDHYLHYLNFGVTQPMRIIFHLVLFIQKSEFRFIIQINSLNSSGLTMIK